MTHIIQDNTDYKAFVFKSLSTPPGDVLQWNYQNKDFAEILIVESSHEMSAQVHPQSKQLRYFVVSWNHELLYFRMKSYDVVV